MQLIDNKHITKALAGQLLKDKWTMETIATTRPYRLTKYKGVGAKTAQNIIDEARRLVNEAKFQATAQLEAQAQPEPEGPAVSARIKRIREQNAT